MIEVFDEEAVKECLDELEDSDIKDYAFWTLEWAINKRKVSAIKIPQNATNGDAIKAIFPNIKIEEIDNDFLVVRNWDIQGTPFFKVWWNAPYKAESEDKE